MVETCINCEYYQGILESPYSNYHIHNWCDLWKTRIPCHVVFDKMNLDTGYDDIECGYSSCYGFSPNPKTMCRADGMFEELRRYNEEQSRKSCNENN